MKRYIFFLLMLALPSFVFGQKPRLEFKETTFQFGEINEGDGKVSHLFQFKNIGKTPLIIKNVRAGCGCTKPEWSREPIAPGATGNIKITFDPQNRVGSFVKSIAVNSNASNSVVTLTVRGKVKASPYNPYRYSIGSLKYMEDHVNVGDINHTKQKSQTITFINTGKEQVTLTPTPSHPAIQMASTITIPQGDTAQIKFQYHADRRKDWGFVVDHIRFTDKQQNECTIHVITNIMEDFSSYNNNYDQAPDIHISETEKQITYTTPNSIHTHEFYIQNVGKTDLIIRKIVTQDEDVSITLPKYNIKPGKKIKATFQYSSKKTANTIKLIRFICNSPKQPIINYKLYVNPKQDQ